jgi:hypothetical protein
MTVNYTYPRLVSEILAYLERNDTETIEQVPNFIMLGIRRISKECKTLGLKNFIYGSLTPGVWIYAKPGNWRSTSTITLINTKPPNSPNNPTFGQKFPLKIVSFSYCELYAPDVTVEAQPLYYSDYDYYHWYIAPTPDHAYPISVGNYTNELQIDQQMQQNFLIQQAPELLLYASLLEAQNYIKSPPDMKAAWKATYDESLGKFNQEDTLRMFDSYSNRQME